MKPKGFENAMSELSNLRKVINKRYGEGTLVVGDEPIAIEEVTRVSTGSFGLDMEMGGGWPENHISVLVGPYAAAKTTMALKSVAQAQLKYPEKDAIWMEVEPGSLDRDWAGKQGVDVSKLTVARPFYMEQAFDIADVALRTKGVSVIVIDSLAALCPARALEDSMEDSQVGLDAFLISKFLKKATASLRYKKTFGDRDDKVTLILLQQIRQKIGGGGGRFMGPIEIMPGGKALEHYPSVIVKFRRGAWKTEKVGGREETVGQECKFFIEKNKTFPARRNGTFDFYFQDTSTHRAGEIDRLKEVLPYAILWDVITKKGAWYYVDDDTYFQGGKALLEYLRETPGALEKIEKKVAEVSTRNRGPEIPLIDSIDSDTGETIY